jgi:hypothetical protein
MRSKVANSSHTRSGDAAIHVLRLRRDRSPWSSPTSGSKATPSGYVGPAGTWCREVARPRRRGVMRAVAAGIDEGHPAPAGRPADGSAELPRPRRYRRRSGAPACQDASPLCSEIEPHVRDAHEPRNRPRTGAPTASKRRRTTRPRSPRSTRKTGCDLVDRRRDDRATAAPCGGRSANRSSAGVRRPPRRTCTVRTAGAPLRCRPRTRDPRAPRSRARSITQRQRAADPLSTLAATTCRRARSPSARTPTPTIPAACRRTTRPPCPARKPPGVFGELQLAAWVDPNDDGSSASARVGGRGTPPTRRARIRASTDPLIRPPPPPAGRTSSAVRLP